MIVLPERAAVFTVVHVFQSKVFSIRKSVPGEPFKVMLKSGFAADGAVRWFLAKIALVINKPPPCTITTLSAGGVQPSALRNAIVCAPGESPDTIASLSNQ